MIVVGLAGGMGQGKSTVGEMLRQLAGVDYKADLETSYPISAVLNAWMATWPAPATLEVDRQLATLANELIKSLPPILEQITGKTAPASELMIKPEDEASLKLHNRLLKYLAVWVSLSASEREAQLPTPINPNNKGLHRALLMWLGGVMIELVSPTIWCDVLDRRIKQLAGRGYPLVSVGGIRYPQDAAMIRANGGLVLRVERPNSHASNDVTETSSAAIEPDVKLYNDGGLAELEKAVMNLWHDLKAGQPTPEYRAIQAKQA